jgi:hypothetical protein
LDRKLLFLQQVCCKQVGRLGLEPRTNTLKGYCSTN